MSLPSITSANAVYMLGVQNLFPVAQQLQNFSTDSAFDTEAAEMGVAEKGVDGVMVAGYVPYMNSQTIMLSAASTSVAIFDALIAAEKVAKEKYVLFGTIRMVSTGYGYTLTNGVLTRAPVMPNARRTLQPRSFVIMWDDIQPSPI